MGKKQREKKMAKLSQVEMEKQAIEARRHERLEPVTKFAKRVSITVAATILLFAIGVIINGHLQVIASRLGNH